MVMPDWRKWLALWWTRALGSAPLVAAVLVVGGALLAAPAPADAAPGSDAHPLRWMKVAEGGASVVGGPRHVAITIPARPTGGDVEGAYESACRLKGDFDVQVDFALTKWPAKSGVRAGLIFGDTFNALERLSYAPNDGSATFAPNGPTELYLTDLNRVSIPTDQRIGKLRQTRSGNVVTSYCLSGSRWAKISSGPYTTDAVWFGVAAWTNTAFFSGQETRVVFSEPQVSGGVLSCPAGGRPKRPPLHSR